MNGSSSVKPRKRRYLMLTLPPAAKRRYRVFGRQLDLRTGRKPTTVRIATLRNLQLGVSRAGVLHHLHNPELAQPIKVIRIARELVIVDGHHRVCAAMHRGQKFIDALVYSLRPAEYRTMLSETLDMERFLRRHI